MNNNDLVVVDVNGGYGHVYDFCTEENSAEVVAKAQKKAAEQVATYESHIKNYPDRADYWRRCQAQYKNAKYEVMTFDEYLKRQKMAMTSGEVTETTAEQFNDALNCLPPLHWCTIAGVEMFCMREMYTGSYTTQYAKVGDKYYTAMVDVFDQKTWIHNRLEKNI